MCFVVACKQCGKSGWGGCGKHLPSLYASIEQGNHCLCRPWPGVSTASDQPPTGEGAKGTFFTANNFGLIVTPIALILIVIFFGI